MRHPTERRPKSTEGDKDAASRVLTPRIKDRNSRENDLQQRPSCHGRPLIWTHLAVSHDQQQDDGVDEPGERQIKSPQDLDTPRGPTDGVET